MMKTIIEIDGQLVKELELETDLKEPARLTAKAWTTYAGTIQKIAVLIGTSDELLTELILQPDISSKGKPIFKNSDADENYFYWAIATPGTQPGTFGFTVGVLDKEQSKQEEPPAALPTEWTKQRQALHQDKYSEKTAKSEKAIF